MLLEIINIKYFILSDTIFPGIYKDEILDTNYLQEHIQLPDPDAEKYAVLYSGGIKPEKAHVIYNGYKGEFFSLNGILPQKKRFIHASTWYRGVKNFIEIWPMILKEI